MLLFFLLTGCGVKAAPLKPADHVIKSYLESYTGPDNEVKTSPKVDKKKK